MGNFYTELTLIMLWILFKNLYQHYKSKYLLNLLDVKKLLLFYLSSKNYFIMTKRFHLHDKLRGSNQNFTINMLKLLKILDFLVIFFQIFGFFKFLEIQDFLSYSRIAYYKFKKTNLKMYFSEQIPFDMLFFT